MKFVAKLIAVHYAAQIVSYSETQHDDMHVNVMMMSIYEFLIGEQDTGAQETNVLFDEFVKFFTPYPKGPGND